MDTFMMVNEKCLLLTCSYRLALHVLKKKNQHRTHLHIFYGKYTCVQRYRKKSTEVINKLTTAVIWGRGEERRLWIYL